MEPMHISPQGSETVFRFNPAEAGNHLPEFDLTKPCSKDPAQWSHYERKVFSFQPHMNHGPMPSLAEARATLQQQGLLQQEEPAPSCQPVYTLDLTQQPQNLKERPAKTPLDEVVRRLPALPPHVKDLLWPKFEPCEYCPSCKLCDVATHATVPPPRFLDHKNAHPWDQRIVFVDEPHKYFIDGSCDEIISATTFISCFFPKFHAEQMALQVTQGKTFRDTVHRKSHKYHGCETPEDVIKRWDSWAQLGTGLHANIESYYNQEPFQIHPENLVPYGQFQKLFADDKWVNWEPFRTEWSVFDPETMVAGQIDFTGMINRQMGHIVLIDWKRCASIPHCCFNRFRGLPPQMGYGVCQELENCKLMKYSLQLNLYKYIVEKHYGLYVQKMYLVQLHPVLKQKGAAIWKVPDLQGVIEQMMACRKLVLQEYRAQKTRLAVQ
jgi:hypothetical protein